VPGIGGFFAGLVRKWSRSACEFQSRFKKQAVAPGQCKATGTAAIRKEKDDQRIYKIYEF
jgi:hypothetical protein